MTKLTKLLPTDLIAVEVPKDATNIKIGFIEEAEFTEIAFDDGTFYCFTEDAPLLQGKYELLGEVTADEITFDVEPYFKGTLYNTIRIASKSTFDKNKAFYSLLNSNGLYFKNILGGKFCNLNKRGFPSEEWRKAESKVIKGKLLILKPVN